MKLQKIIKKQASVIAAAMALSLLLTSCQTPVSAEAETETMTAEMTTLQETEPETEPLPVTLDASEIRIGMIFYGTEEEASVLSRSLREELTEAALAAGMEEGQIHWVYMDREADWTEIEDAILSCVDSGCQLIFGAAREYAGVIAAIAEEYPDVMFASVESDLSNGVNSGTYRIDLAAVQYLGGVAAALSDTTGHIGFLAAKDSDNETVTAAVNAFAYGVWTVNPDAVVELGVTGKWYLPEAEQQAIQDFQDWDCHVVGGLTDCYTGLQTALEDGLTVVAYGTDSWISEEYRGQIAGAAEYQWDQYFRYMIRQVIEKNVIGEVWTGDLGSGDGSFSTSRDWDLSFCREMLQNWFPDLDPEPEETVPDSAGFEETASESAESEGAEETEAEETEAEETEAEETESEMEELPVIELDEETGYLANVRVHKIVIPEEE